MQGQYTNKATTQTFERARSIGFVIPKPEEADDDEKVDDLLGVAFDVDNERVCNRRGRPNNDDDLVALVSLRWRKLAKFPKICIRTEGIMWITIPSKGDFPVGQFDAQILLPKGRGTPSFASSWLTRAAANAWCRGSLLFPDIERWRALGCIPRSSRPQRSTVSVNMYVVIEEGTLTLQGTRCERNSNFISTDSTIPSLQITYPRALESESEMYV